MRKLIALLVFLLSAFPAFGGPPDERVERIKANLRFKPVFAQTISKLQIADFLGVTTATAGCAPFGQARAFYDPNLNQFKVLDSSCTNLLTSGGGGSASVAWNQLLNPNGNSSPNFGGTAFTFSNGIWDWGTMDLRLPRAAGPVLTTDGQISYDTSGTNLLFYGGFSSVLGRFDSSTALTDGSIVGISVAGSGQVKLVPAVTNTPTGTSVLQVTNTNVTLGDSVCVTDLGPPLEWDNCTPGVPTNVQTGTTYTYDGVNDRGTAIFANNAGQQTYSLGQISDAGNFDANWFAFQGVLKGILNVNATTSLFASTGSTSETLLLGQNCSFFTDPTGSGTIYPKCSEPRMAAGSGISLQRSANLLTISSTPAAANVNQLISGGGVSWTSGLTFEVSAATYQIGGVTYTSSEGSVTLGAADPTNPRIDVIAVNSSGAVVVVAGTPSANPSAPSIDPTTQLSLTFVTIPAASSIPVVSNSVLYRNNAGSPTEYNCTNSANINCNSTNNPFSPYTHSIEGTAVVQGNNAVLTIGSGQVNLNTFDILVFYIRNKGAWPNATNLQIFWRNGSVNVGTAITFKPGVYGFDQGNITAYQQIVIPISAFQTGNTPITNLSFKMQGSGTLGFYLGNIQLQSGFSGGGGSGGGTSFQLAFNGVNQPSPVNIANSASVTSSCSAVGGVSTCSFTSINGGVTSLTGDGTLFTNSGSTGAVTLQPATIGSNLFFGGPSSPGTSNCVQGCTTALTNSSNSATVLTKAYGTSVGTGHLLIASVACFAGFCNTNAVTSTNNGTWTKALSVNHGAEVSVYYVCNSTGGSETVTLTSSGSAFDMEMHIFEFSGNATASCFDASGTATPNSVNTFTATTSGGVAQSTELLFGAISANLATPINGTGNWTTLANTVTTNYGLASMVNTQTTGLSGTQTVTAQVTSAPTQWSGAILTFKLNTSGSGLGAPRAIVLADLPLHTPSICSSCAATGSDQTSATSDTFMDSPPSNQLYRFTGSISCFTSVATATATLNLKYTDTSNTAQTVSVTATCTTLGSASIGSLVQALRAKSATNITYGVTIANSPHYDVDVRLEKMN